MYDTKPRRMIQAKSYTSIYDIFGSMPFNNVLYRNPNKNKNDKYVFQATCGDTTKVASHVNNSSLLNDAMLVTSEKYHGLNKHISRKSIVKSTSTIFYDLDDIAKRHSFNCLTELTLSSAHVFNIMNASTNQRAFRANSNAIVQECSTQIQPKLVPRDSIEVNMKRGKAILNDAMPSSEIFLRDDDYLKDYSKTLYIDKEITDRQQKFWSYAKYRTEYTNPIPEEKKIKKKDRGKRTEDPCPCQLFSYACPCSDKKSLTELAKNSKSLTLADQITSTTKIIPEGKQDPRRAKKHKHVRDDKPTNTSFYEKVEVAIPKQEPVIQVANHQDTTLLGDSTHNDKISTKSKTKSHKKPRVIVCPNCNEKVDIASTTEEEECLNPDSSTDHNKERSLPSTDYAYKTSSKTAKHKTHDIGDTCNHEPPCELVPVCQILPTNNVFMHTNCIRKPTQPTQKSTQKVIKITKACRHHPPCTVVPSCQRANVLKNNCEFIPPCLHRPRCVNLPLCVPFAKSVPYEELANKLIEDIHSDCPHVPKCKYIPECQQDGNNIDPADIIARAQNPCEFYNQFSPAFMTSPKAGGLMNSYSPTIPQYVCNNCKSNKSCQCNCYECSHNLAKGSVSDEAVMFIRDVGCQFHAKTYSPKDSVMPSKSSSASFDYVDAKMGNFYTNVHTVRYEDKYTSPVSCEEFSFSTDSITSFEIDSKCPSHGHQAPRYFQKAQPSDINPKFNQSPYITAFVTQASPILRYMAARKSKENAKLAISGHNSLPVKSRRSFLKNKYRKMFGVKRRKKSRICNSLFSYNSSKPTFHENSV